MILEFTVLFVVAFIAMMFASLSGGGSLLTLPALMFFGLPPATAVGTNRFGVLVQTFGRIPNLIGKLNIGLKIPAILIASHTIGGIIGAFVLISIANDELLFKILGLLLVFGAIVTYFSGKGMQAKSKNEIPHGKIAISGFALFFIGIYRGFFGPAAGIFDRLLSVHVIGLDFIQATALGNYYTFFSSVAAFIIFFYAGIIDFWFALPVALGGLIGAYIGTKYLIEKGNEFMKMGFVVLEMLFGLYFIFFGVNA